MKKIIFLYPNFYNEKNDKLKIGGVETYLKNLCNISISIGLKPYVIQNSKKYFEKKISNITIIGTGNYKNKYLLKKAYTIADKNNDILVFGSSHMNLKNDFTHSIAIQHGIYWDKPKVKNILFSKNITTFLKCFQIFLEIKRNQRVNKIICVDYNYLNWYRALTRLTNENLIVIPNFTPIPFSEKKAYERNKIKIIYARRFEEIRGITLMEKAFSILLKKYNNIELTFAGEGSLSSEVQSFFSDNKNVHFTSYEIEQSVSFHKNFDIAIIPSTASEGTSLSLLEAMAAKCCIITTNIGGLSNIVINNFNGIIINPKINELVAAIEYLIKNPQEIGRMAETGYETVKQGFSYEQWQKNWIRVLKDEM